MSRKSIDEALVNMFTSLHYRTNALFYAHIISQMNIVLNDMPYPAAVSFHINRYNLYINEELFGEYSLDDRIFILIHECLHILMNHLGDDGRLSKEDKRLSNIAQDCAINQLIKGLEIPEVAVVPEKIDANAKLLESSEYYYNLLKRDPEKADSLDTLDDHSLMVDATAHDGIVNDTTEKMINQAITETIKQRGKLPDNIQELIDLFSNKPQLNWRQLLRRIVGHKKVLKRSTNKKSHRRFPDREDIKGITRDVKFNVIVVVDVSKSMDNESILIGLNEISNICKSHNANLKVLQVDTDVQSIDKFSNKTKVFTRNGNGGTCMYSGVEYILDNKIEHDCVVYITDGYIEDIRKWPKQLKCPVIWLFVEDVAAPWDGFGKHRVFKLKV